MRSVMATGIVAAAAMLAGCGQKGAETTANTTVNTASHGYLAKVSALPPGQVRGVLYRAIVDGQGQCQALSDFKRNPDEAGKAVWGARCTNGTEWVVRIGDDGIAQVTGANPPR